MKTTYKLNKICYDLQLKKIFNLGYLFVKQI